MLLRSDINKVRLSQFSKLDQFYINYASTRILKISKNDFIEYNNQIYPNNSHIHLRSGDAASSYNFTFPITGSKIPK